LFVAPIFAMLDISSLLDCGSERTLAILSIEEHAHAGSHDLLERLSRLDRVPSEPWFLRHDQHVERRARAQRIDQPAKCRPARELQSWDAVVGVNVSVV
jgi:hypothetical protein